MIDKVKLLRREIDYIKDDIIRNFTIVAVNLLPDYFAEIPASSSGKYHPSYALGIGGLLRHTIAAVNIANCMFHNTTVCGNFTDRHKDLIVSALILHDGLKSGLPQQPHTEERHPVGVTVFLRNEINLAAPNMYDSVMDEVFPLIQTHMGQWNTTKEGKEFIGLPASGPARYVHMCDFLASRKFIEINFDAL